MENSLFITAYAVPNFIGLYFILEMRTHFYDRQFFFASKLSGIQKFLIFSRCMYIYAVTVVISL